MTYKISQREARKPGQVGEVKQRRDLLFMVALCNRADYYIFIVFLSSFFFLSFFFFFFFFFSSPNLSGRRLDVYHTLAHGVAFVRI